MWTIARVTWRRTLRGRALWVGAMVAVLPALFALVLRQSDDTEAQRITRTFAFELLVLAVLPALLVAASVGEEIEDRTITYLWSRPVPRWSIIAGKLVAMVPLVWALTAASWLAASFVANHELPEPASVLALVIAGSALAVIAAAIATLAARYSMALVICYMLFFDLPMGAMPAAIEHVSITRHARVIAGTVAQPDEVSIGNAMIGILLITVIWGVVGLWRVRRLEA